MSVLNDLTDREKDIFLRRVGIKNGDIETLEEVSRCYGLTRERVRQIEACALAKLGQHYANVDERVAFMRTWQKADSIKLAAKAAGVSYAYALQLSHKLREEGIPLKKHPHGGVKIKSMTKLQRMAIDPVFKARKERNDAFMKMWNDMVPTPVIAREFSLGSRSAVNARAAHLRQVGYAVVRRGSNRVMKVTSEEFVRIWQAAGSVKEVVDKTGMKYGAVQARRNTLRDKGVPLKSFHQYEKLTPSFVDRLKRIALECVGVR